MKVKQLALLKRQPGTSFGSTFFFFFFLPAPAWHRHSNLEGLISGRDGSHDSSDPRLIKSPYQDMGSWEEELEGIQGRQKKKREREKILPASSFTGQIKTTAEQVIKQEIMNSIILFSV